MKNQTLIRWGIVGTGVMAELFANALPLVKGAVLHGVSSRRSGTAGAFAARTGASHSYRNPGELLHDPAIDIVYIAARNEHHREDSLAAISAGKAVLCEKPFAMNEAEGRDIVEAARRRGVFCMEAMWMRCSPAVREVVAMVRGGGLGAPVFVSAQLGFAVKFDPLHRVFIKPGGGALLDLGVYPLSFAHALLGRPMRIKTAAHIGPTGVDDQVAAVLEYESGCQAVVAASLRTQLTNAAAIHGTDGIIDLAEPLYFPESYYILKPILHTPDRSKPRSTARGPRGGARAGKIIRHRVANGYACEAELVQRCLRKGLLESPEMPLDESLEVLASMDVIRGHFKEKV